MGFDQPSHWLVIIVVALVLFFGWKKLPEMARSAGKSMRVFKTELKGMADDDDARDQAKKSNTVTDEAPTTSEETVTPPSVQTGPTPGKADPPASRAD